MGGFDYGEAAVLACVEAVRAQISTTLFDEVDKSHVLLLRALDAGQHAGEPEDTLL
jgi:hypothetical protein